MTRDLILRGKDIFPLSNATRMGSYDPSPSQEGLDAVNKGIIIGTKLGRKLQIRNEINFDKSYRKLRGKLNKRQLHEASFDADDLFYKVNVELYNKSTLHISVDASSSMIGKKWVKTMTSVVAICKATSMINNIHVTVSFRSTQYNDVNSLPYVVMAYDSNVDKFSKIKLLFPYLEPNGSTPEGLAFEAIMGLFNKISPDEENRYFLNLSDGEPCYSLQIPSLKTNISYMNDVGVSHTKHQVDKIRNKNVEILSYFITEDNAPLSLLFKNTYSGNLKENFHKMYGRDAKFIDVNSVIDLSKTINEKFLQKTL
jgi:hypothetical protein